MNISIIAENKDLCCGCNACGTVCPKQAIQMLLDQYGNAYPSVNEEKCVNCSICVNVCCKATPVIQRTPQTVFAASYFNCERTAKSSSGGIFPALAEKVIEEGGIVYGTRLDDTFEASVVGIQSKNELSLLQGSKYVHSNMGEVFKEIEIGLQKGKKVLFSGVPCQVAAVRAYLRKDYDNLITVDIVCHGTPSNQLFLDYIEYIQKKKKIEIVEFLFRHKNVRENRKGKVLYNQDHKGRVVYKIRRWGRDVYKEKVLKAYQSSYYKLFLRCAIFREGCYHCEYSSPNRVGDITIGDYWGVNEVHPDFCKRVHEEKLCGVSAVMINTEKGRQVFSEIEDKLLIIPTVYSNVRKYNPNLNEPSKKNLEYDAIMRLYQQEGYKAVDKYYHRKYRLKIIASSIGQIFPYKVKKKIIAMKGKILK